MDSTSSDTDEDLEVIDLLDSTDYEEESNTSVSDGAITNNNDQLVNDYELLSTSDLIYEMEKLIQELISIVIVISEPIARCLLNHYKWNVQQLVVDYYDSNDLDGFFQSIGIYNPATVLHSSLTDSVDECVICCTLFADTRTTKFVCGHQFCRDCCSQYFQSKILNDGEGNKIECPDSKCKILIDDTTIMESIPENAKHRFEILMTQTFVLCNPLMRYCRSEDCEWTIKVKELKCQRVNCYCGFESCLKCGEMWHDSVTCELLEKWIQCCIDESYKWMIQNAKKCPNCSINIEKNGGCNHMRCRSCNHEFCWICMQDWRRHSNCNQYQQHNENVAERFEHYSLRYKNHIQSMKLERGLYNSVESKMKDLQGMTSLTNNELLFLKRAVESLQQSRQILVSTYVFAYYAKQSNQLSIFEDNQSDLELATENLAWFLEQEITIENMRHLKQKLQEQYTYCDKRRIVLLDHIHEGFEKGYWELKDSKM